MAFNVKLKLSTDPRYSDVKVAIWLLVVAVMVAAMVVIGGIKRIGNVTGKLVPTMVVVYTVTVLYIIFSNASQIIPAFQTIFHDAFTGDAVLGGSLGAIIITGVRRAAFSNEAGLGTAPMAHGAAKTSEPIGSVIKNQGFPWWGARTENASKTFNNDTKIQPNIYEKPMKILA